MSVTREDVERIAGLAALAVDEASLPELTRQIGRILEYVSQLEALDPAGVEPQATSPQAGPWPPLRPDDASRASLAVPPAGFAPAFRDGLFLVPRLEAVGEE